MNQARYLATGIPAIRLVVSGVATAPGVVVAFWLWAARVLRQAGVPNRRSLPAAIAFVAGFLAFGHLAAYLLTRNQP